MKKRLLLILMALYAQVAGAQTGSLTLKNHTSCTIYVNMLAIEPAMGDGAPCSLVSCSFTVPPGPPTVYANPGVFASPLSGPTFCTQTVSIPLSWWAVNPSPADFNWTDVNFQYGCEPPGACNGGGQMNSFYSFLIGTCTGTAPSWSYSTCGHAATWNTTNVQPYDVTIDFY